VCASHECKFSQSAQRQMHRLPAASPVMALAFPQKSEQVMVAACSMSTPTSRWLFKLKILGNQKSCSGEGLQVRRRWGHT